MHKKILNKTHSDYNAIADRFSRARKETWKEFDFLFDNLKEKEDVLDLGCGNGRFYEKLKKGKYIGVDNSEELIKIAKEKYGKEIFLVADALKLPFQDQSFNKVYSFAVLHHLPFECHEQFKEEVLRVLKKDGEFILTVWDLKKRCEKEDVKRVSENEILIPWHGLEDHYFYIFDLKKLEELFKEFKIISKGEIKVKNKNNYYVVFKKI